MQSETHTSTIDGQQQTSSNTSMVKFALVATKRCFFETLHNSLAFEALMSNKPPDISKMEKAMEIATAMVAPTMNGDGHASQDDESHKEANYLSTVQPMAQD